MREQDCKFASLQVGKFASLQVCKFASLQVSGQSKFASFSTEQVCKFAISLSRNLAGGKF